jgi:7-carboxy-7-deazaguanine synthase
VRLYEIYNSISGETQYAGLPMTLVRFAKCDLRCSYCDTEYAFTGGCEISVEALVEDIARRGQKLVLLTGGEPLLQRDLPELAQKLIARSFEVMLETGGHRDLSTMPPEVRCIVDLKTPGSGEAAHNHFANLERLGRKDAVKFVVTSHTDYDWAKRIIAEYRLSERTEVLLSPSFGAVDPKELVGWMLEDRLQARLNLQLHKYVWPPDTRGV